VEIGSQIKCRRWSSPLIEIVHTRWWQGQTHLIEPSSDPSSTAEPLIRLAKHKQLAISTIKLNWLCFWRTLGVSPLLASQMRWWWPVKIHAVEASNYPTSTLGRLLTSLSVDNDVKRWVRNDQLGDSKSMDSGSPLSISRMKWRWQGQAQPLGASSDLS
jgi:hypothetical protein